MCMWIHHGARKDAGIRRMFETLRFKWYSPPTENDAIKTTHHEGPPPARSRSRRHAFLASCDATSPRASRSADSADAGAVRGTRRGCGIDWTDDFGLQNPARPCSFRSPFPRNRDDAARARTFKLIHVRHAKVNCRMSLRHFEVSRVRVRLRDQVGILEWGT